MPNRIKEVRTKARQTRAQMAEELDVSPSTIASWEYGQRSLSPEMIVKIADMYNVSTDYLLGRTSAPLDDIKIPTPTTLAAHETEGAPPVSDDEMERVIRAAYELILEKRKKEGR